jgi:hypothetical protein
MRRAAATTMFAPTGTKLFNPTAAFRFRVWFALDVFLFSNGVAQELFKKDKPPPGPHDKSRYSKLTGCHYMPWSAEVKEAFRGEFNHMADDARAESRGASDKNENDGSAIRKNMTRLLQYIPPLDVGEKVLHYLLGKAGKTRTQRLAMTGSAIVTALAGIDIDKILTELNVADIAPEVLTPSVTAAMALGTWQFPFCC